MSDPMFEAAQALKGTDSQMKSISDLMVRENNLASQLATYESVVADIKQQLNTVRQSELPQAMQAAGVDEFKCAETGTRAVLAFECSGALGSDEEERERKIEILIGAGADEIVKTEVRAAFGKGDYEKAQRLLNELGNLGYAVTMGRTIHPQTLRAWVKERVEAGDSLPLDQVGLWSGTVAKIKRPKVDSGQAA